MEDGEWEDLEDKFRDHFPDEDTEVDDSDLSFDSGDSTFLVSRSGTIKASMPLHSFIAEDFVKIEFGDEHVKVQCQGVMYEFRQ